MDPQRRALLQTVLVCVDVCLLVALWWVVPDVRAWVVALWPLDLVPGERVLQPLAPADARALGLVLVPVWLAVLHLRGHWQEPAVPRRGGLAVSVVIAMVVGTAAFALVKVDVSRTMLVGYTVASWAGLVSTRALVGSVAFRWGQPWHVLLVGPEAAVERGAAHPGLGAAVVGRVSGEALAPAIYREVLRGPVDEIRMCGAGGPGELEEVARLCSELGMSLRVEPDVWGPAAAQQLSLSFSRHRSGAMVLKRVIDVLLGGVLVLLSLPVLAVLVTLVWLEDRQSPWFVQERVGLHGRRFSMWKIRSMRVGAERDRAALDALNEADGPAFKMTHDPRVTRIGRVLRRWSLDELPQLWHVLAGTMSLVGPRPALPDEVERYTRQERRRLAMRPGLTCIWQVSGRSELSWHQWMAMDLEYVDGWSPWLDVVLLVRTIPAVLSGRGAR